jgi:uncharacterized membrane protein
VARVRTLALAASALAAAELGILLGPVPIRVASGLTLGCILPGFVISRVILNQRRIEGSEQLLLIPGLSLAIAVITGLVLNTAHIRLTAVSWAIALGLVSAAGLVAVARLEDGHEVKPMARGAPARVTRASLGGRHALGIGPAAMFVFAALAVTAAVTIGVLGQRQHDSETAFTQLWALPGLSSGSIVRLGVASHERGDVRYRIRVSVEGRVVRSQALMLRPGQMWQSTQRVARSAERVDVALLTSPHGRVYREVHLAAR